MRLMFAHDHTFFRHQDQFYSTGSLSKEMLERYTGVFDEVVVVSRQKELEAYDGTLTLASADRVEFVRIPDFKSVKNSYRVKEARRKIEEELRSCDCLIARLPSAIASLAVAFARKNHIPYLVEVVTCPWDALWNHSLLGKLVAPFSYLETRRIVRDSRFTVYVTSAFLQKRYPTCGRNVNCSNVALEEAGMDVLERRLKRIGEMDPKGKIVVGTTAALNVRHKGQRYVIRALGRLKERGVTNIEYQLVGGGSPEALMKLAKRHHVEDQVKFLGTMPHSQVFTWLDGIDLYVQPSRQEGLPRALIEAMSRGVPSLGARTAGIPELLDPEFTFSNSLQNVEEIVRLLQSFSREVMQLQAARNYREALTYNREEIEKRRRGFFMEFMEYVSESRSLEPLEEDVYP